ncbi:MAG TPA: IS200/IS605 family transposase [Chthonomonadaceae bacterium]|nr:IS200/IS605 family transposase [Chthonomonadaceae bacterium]
MASAWRRNKLCVCVHFVWATKDRLPLITEAIERDLFRCVRGICQDLRCDCLAIGGVDDHVHLLVSLCSTVALGRVMKEVKGGSSRFVSATVAQDAWFAWQPNYAAISVSPSHRRRVVRYIENQKQHHAQGTEWPQAVETDMEVFTDEA